MVLSQRWFCTVCGGRGDATGIQQVEARGAVKHPPMPREAPVAKNYPAPHVNSAKAEKSCCRFI